MKPCYVQALLLFALILTFFLAPIAFGEIDLFTADTFYQPPASSLYTIDPITGTSTFVGDCEVQAYMAGLGYDPQNDILYGTTTLSDNLYSINYSTGPASLIGSLGAELMHGLTYDTSSEKLYGTYGWSEGDGLYEIDVSTGAATLIGHIGFFHPNHLNTVHGLALHPETHVLYGAVGGPEYNWGALVEIDKSTAKGTLIAEWTPHIAGLAFHPESHILYGIDNWSGELYTVDIVTGIPALVGYTGLNNPLGLEFAPEPATVLLLGLGGAIFLRRRRN